MLFDCLLATQLSSHYSLTLGKSILVTIYKSFWKKRHISYSRILSSYYRLLHFWVLLRFWFKSYYVSGFTTLLVIYYVSGSNIRATFLFLECYHQIHTEQRVPDERVYFKLYISYHSFVISQSIHIV